MIVFVLHISHTCSAVQGLQEAPTTSDQTPPAVNKRCASFLKREIPPGNAVCPIGSAMSRQSNLQHNLHIRGSGYLDSSFLNERFMVSEYPLKYGHAIPGVLPGLQCQRMTISPYCANSHVHELSWNSTPSAIQSNGLYSAMGNQNSNTPVLNWRVARTKMNGFPHLDAYRDMMCSSHLCSDRSRAHGSRDAFKSQLFQQEQTGCYSYADPLSKAPIQYLQRLSEMATLERNTIRQEDMKKLRTKKED